MPLRAPDRSPCNRRHSQTKHAALLSEALALNNLRTCLHSSTTMAILFYQNHIELPRYPHQKQGSELSLQNSQVGPQTNRPEENSPPKAAIGRASAEQTTSKLSRMEGKILRDSYRIPNCESCTAVSVFGSLGQTSPASTCAHVDLAHSSFVWRALVTRKRHRRLTNLVRSKTASNPCGGAIRQTAHHPPWSCRTIAPHTNCRYESTTKSTISRLMPDYHLATYA